MSEHETPANNEERIRVRRLEWALWGARDSDGLVSDVNQLRKDLNAWKDQERERREKQAQQQQTGTLMVKLAAGSAALALVLAGINTIVTIGFG